jgi:hypothetical protein
MGYTVENLFARVRSALGPAATQYPGGDNQPPAINGRGDLICVEGMPFLAETVRAGNSYVGFSALQTPVNAVPTTTAGVSLWNGEGAGGKSYVIDSIVLFNGVTQALATNFQMMVMINVGAVATPSGGTAITPKGFTGKPYGGLAKVGSGTTVVNDVWVGFGSSLVVQNTANFGATLDVPVNGLYIVKPNGAFSIAGLVANTPVATSVQLGIRWHEINVEMA